METKTTLTLSESNTSEAKVRPLYGDPKKGIGYYTPVILLILLLFVILAEVVFREKFEAFFLHYFLPKK